MNNFDIRYQWIAHGDNGTLVLTDEFHDSSKLDCFAALALQLTRHDYKPPFSVDHRYRKPFLNISQLGKYLIICITKHYSAVIKSFSDYRFEPMIQIILDKISEKENEYQSERHISFIEETAYIKAAFEFEYRDIIEKYNRFAIELRSQLLDAGMKERVKSFRRNARERCKQFVRGCSTAMERHSKCLAIRLDTASRRIEFPRKHPTEISRETFDEQCLEIEKHRNEFIKHLTRTFGSNLAFYAWKIEYGINRGFHIHWFLLLNGNKYQDRINIPMHLGEHWQYIITQGKGTYRNVNSDHAEKTSGLRVMHHSDANLWDHINKIASYLTKVDYHIKLVLTGNMRSFGCSKTRNPPKNKPGPKRKTTTTTNNNPTSYF